MTRLVPRIIWSLALPAWLTMLGLAFGQHQTPSFTPIQFGQSLPYRIELREYDFGTDDLPGLHSYAAGRFDGKWVLIAGRSNGVHDLDQSGEQSFPPESQNRDVWVIDPVSRQSWHRSLGDPNAATTDPASGLTPNEIASLTPTNNQFTQSGDRLYVTGGYGLNTAGEFTTFDVLTAIDLPGMIDWVTSGSGLAADQIRQVTHPVASVAGGAMYEMGGRFHLVFGQDFEGAYSPRSDGAYTRQVRSFDIVDDGVNLAVANITQTPQLPEYRRRDLNVVPVVRPDGSGGTEEGLLALSGVFTTSFGTWTVPVEIDFAGGPAMADPNQPDTFKQGFNGYHSAKLGLYSESDATMHEVLFGGISAQYYDQSLAQVVTDNDLPFVNDVTAVTIDVDGDYSQQHLGFFPEVLDNNGNPWRFGANAEFFLADGIETFNNGVIKLDALSGEERLGFVFGGIMTNAPHTRGIPGVTSTASFRIFEVRYAAVPEAGTLQLFCFGISMTASYRPTRVMKVA